MIFARGRKAASANLEKHEVSTRRPASQPRSTINFITRHHDDWQSEIPDEIAMSLGKTALHI